VFGLDESLAGLGTGGSLLVVAAVAVLLGLRHAADPDHLVAVSTLVASEARRPARRATLLGLAWGVGHGTTLFAFGLPIVLLGSNLPHGVRAAAEFLVGLLIVALAARLLVLWRRGGFHAHSHPHGGVVHTHLHTHAEQPDHLHEHPLLRSPAQAYCLGLVHGVGGSAAIGVLLLASLHGRGIAAIALGLFAAGTAISMAALSSGFGYLLARPSVRRRLEAFAPALAVVAAAFGAWYTVAAIASL
jgi:ABC-type nickel/cobalt efflux system permease component RcnA